MLKCPACFIFSILVDGSWCLSVMSLSKFLNSSFLQLYEVCQYIYKKQPHTMTFPPPNFTAGTVICDQTIFSYYFLGFSKCCAVNNNNKLQHAFSLAMESSAMSLQAMVFKCITWLLGNSDYSVDSIRNLVRSSWLWQFYKTMMFFPFLNNGWRILFCNNMVVKVLWEVLFYPS